MAGQSIIREEQIARAFARIEDELLQSMMRNLDHHRAEELAEGFEWTQWQAVQLAEIERYVRENSLRYGEEFDRLNEQMEDLIVEAYSTGYHNQEAFILDAASKGFPVHVDDEVMGLPTGRLSALLAATHEDMMRAEYATLRRAEDIYKQVVFDAQVYATSGAGTYAQAIDMATRDFLMKGINGIVYKDGSHHSIREYSQMAVRTATKRAALQAEGDARDSYGVHTIFVNYRIDACPECMEWVGQVLIDDVYSGGTAEEAAEGEYALLSDAMAQGLFHPNCRDTATTYFEGINEPPKPFTEGEMEDAVENEEREHELSNAEQHEREWGRVADMSLDPENAAQARSRAEEWGEKAEKIRREQTVRELEQTMLSELPDASEGIASLIMETPDEAARRTAINFLDRLDIADIYLGEKDVSGYHLGTRAIKLRWQDVVYGNKLYKPFQLFFHEYGHLIDNASTNYLSFASKGRLVDAVISDVDALIKFVKKERGFRHIQDARDWITGEVRRLWKEEGREFGASLPDLISGATKAKCCAGNRVGVGHDNSYWKGQLAFLNLGSEAFAEFFAAALANPAELEVMKEHLPNAYKVFEEILEELGT